MSPHLSVVNFFTFPPSPQALLLFNFSLSFFLVFLVVLAFRFGVSIELSDSFTTTFEYFRPMLITDIAFFSLANSLSDFSLFSLSFCCI